MRLERDGSEAPRRIAITGGSSWMIIFADLLALLLTFLVMLFSLLAVNQKNWENIALGLADEFDPGQALILPSQTDQNAEQVLAPALISLDYLYAILQERVARDPSLANVKISRSNDRILLSLDSRGHFDPRTKIISRDFRRSVQVIAGLLSQLRNQVMVFGITGSAAPDTALYQSNWQLSLWKALAVSNELKAAGYAGPVFVVGSGDDRNAPPGFGPPDRVQIEIRNRQWIGDAD